MKLSMSMIESYLSHHETESDILDDERSIHGMRFLSSGKQRSSREYVYIGQASDYLKDPEYADALILASGTSHIVCRSSDYEELLNDVLSAFDFFNNLDQILAKEAAHGGTLDEMIKAIGEALHEPFLVFAIDGTYLAGLCIDELPFAPLKANIEKQGSLGAETIGGYFTDETGIVQHDLTNHARATYSPTGETAVSRYLTQDGERIGFIMCFPRTARSTRFTIDIEEAFAPYLSQAGEFTDALSPYQSQHLALADLVTGETVSRESCSRLIAAVGSDNNYFIICVKSLAISNRTQRLLLASEIEKSAIACAACEVDESVAFLTGEKGIADLIGHIAWRFDEKSAAVGVSMPIADIRQAPIAWRQALFACESTAGAGVRYCRDLALPFLLKTLKNEPATADLLHPALSTLASRDAETHSDLLETLRAYLATGCNQTDCARKLHVHINTLKYRLKRISELTGLDFKDQRDLLYLKLSIELGR